MVSPPGNSSAEIQEMSFEDRDFKIAVTASSLAYAANKDTKHPSLVSRISYSLGLSSKKPLQEESDLVTYKKQIQQISSEVLTAQELNAVPFYKGKDTEPAGYVINTGKEITISFRGTDNLDRSWNNLLFNKMKMDFGDKKGQKMHRGFGKAYGKLKGSLEQALEKVNLENPTTKDLPVTFTGHSYGGAIAQIAALDFATRTDNKKIDPTKIKVITFGAPRVFSRAACMFFNKILGRKTVHFQNKGDVVPGLPKKSSDFEHTGIKTRFDAHAGGHSNDEVYKPAAEEEKHRYVKSKSLEILENNQGDIDLAASSMAAYRSTVNSLKRSALKKINELSSNFDPSKYLSKTIMDAGRILLKNSSLANVVGAVVSRTRSRSNSSQERKL